MLIFSLGDGRCLTNTLIILKFHKFVIHKFVKLLSFYYICTQKAHKFNKLWRKALSTESPLRTIILQDV